MNYVVSQRALDLIELECRRNPNTETGGILVGSQDANQISITHATGPGLQWEGSSYHFVKDTEYLQSVLNTLFEYFGVNFTPTCVSIDVDVFTLELKRLCNELAIASSFD